MPDGGFAGRYGPWALVTGAAGGIGAEFARQIAGGGVNVLLLDRDEETVAARAREIAEESGAEARPVVADLSTLAFLDEVRGLATTHEIGLLVCNAALGPVGPFDATPVEELMASLDVNCRATMALAHALLPGMAERGRGGAILMASNAAYHGTPYVAHYAATKAYNLVLGEGLWYEMRERGVDVLAFAPGPTNTPGLRSANPALPEGAAPPGIMLPGPTAAAALAALGRSPSARPGWRNRLDTFVQTRLLSRRRAILRIASRTRSLRFVRKREPAQGGTPAKDEQRLTPQGEPR